MSVLSATVLLFLVMDPLGNIPVFLSVLKSVDERRQKAVILRELVIALGVLILFLFSGRFILSVLRVSQSSLGIAGGIILFLIAMRMIFSGTETIFPGKYEGEPLIVPLAVPLIAGPSAMTTVMLLITREPSRWFEWLSSLVCAWVVSGFILLWSNVIGRMLGPKVLEASERLMGMLLTAVAVEMLVAGIRQTFFPV